MVEEPYIKPSSFSGMVADCGCPVRREAPELPPLPFHATEENKARLNAFLVNTYRASTFNTCQHQPLLMIHGPPLEFQLKENTHPHAIYTPAAVHWR